MSTQALQRPKTREGRYNAQEVDRALTKLIQCNGVARSAVRELNAEGWDDAPSHTTLRNWIIGAHKDRYLELHEKLGPELERLAIAYARENITGLADKIREGFESVDFNELDGKDRAAAVKNLATAQALQNDKILGPLTGRPTHVVENRTATQIVEAMTSRRWLEPAHIDAQAEVIEEPPEQQTKPPAVGAMHRAEPRASSPEASSV